MVMIKYGFSVACKVYSDYSAAFELSTVPVVTEDRLKYCMNTFFSSKLQSCGTAGWYRGRRTR